MKAIKFANLCIIALALTVAAVGCRKKPTDITPLPGQRGYVGPADSTGLDDKGGKVSSSSDVESGGGAFSDDMSGLRNMNQDRGALASYTVYFDFDSSLVRSSEEGKISEVAGILNSNPQNAVLVEGYCDERGTEGYNLSLGERRALAIREALVRAGVSGNRVDTISFGEENPINPGHNETAWAENRRGVFVLLLP